MKNLRSKICNSSDRIRKDMFSNTEETVGYELDRRIAKKVCIREHSELGLTIRNRIQLKLNEAGRNHNN